MPVDSIIVFAITSTSLEYVLYLAVPSILNPFAFAILPFISVFRLGKMRKIIKAVGNLQGQEYSVTYTVDQKI